MFDKQIVDDIRAEDPNFFNDHLTGFTEFTNNLSHYRSTFPSVVNLLTGARYSYEEPAERYYADAYAEGNFLPALRQQGYSTNIYATKNYTYYDITNLEGLADNMREGLLELDWPIMLKRVVKLSLYCNLPQVLKPYFWFDPIEFEWAVTYGGPEPVYSIDDKRIYDDVSARGLTRGDAQPRFSYFHLEGPHPPFILDRDIRYRSENSVSRTDQAIGSLRVVFAYLDQLKAAGVYEGASIVITGDHGINYLKRYSERLSEPTLTALFVKPRGEGGHQELHTPLAVNNAPVSVENLQGMMLKEAGIAAPPHPGYFQVPESGSEARNIGRLHYWTYHSSQAQQGKMEIFRVIGDANNWENWTKLDEVTLSFTYG